MSFARTMRRRNMRRNGRPRCSSCEQMNRLKPGIFPRTKMVLRQARWVCPNCGRPEKMPAPADNNEGSKEQ